MASKVHVSLDVNNLEESVRFYAALFNMQPTKVRPGYAKFDAETPAVNLTLNQAKHCCLQGLSHLGVRVDKLEEIAEARARLEAAGFRTLEEKQTTCCYALQDKIWAKDPTGYRWEVYVFHGDAEKGETQPAGVVQEFVESVCCPAEKR